MAKQFASVEDEELDNILNNRDSSNTNNVIRMATNVLRKYANENSILMEDFEQLPKQDLCEKLRTFYASLRNKKGEFYGRKFMISIRYSCGTVALRFVASFLIFADLPMVSQYQKTGQRP
jgi:hypothetical protein